MTDDSVESRIGTQVRRYRGDLSQAELARLLRAGGLKWSQTTVWLVENGERPLRLSEAMAVASLLGVTVEQLTGDEVDSAGMRAAELSMLRYQVDQIRKVLS
ncbi:helix-turn-helix transcriptional regulator [Curtobacterium sp. USHLN213]|uniref:helix-turn-helix transcriptional regulator n=1 Tax=Curtobacterium sp. USHLN213 TaxID=3081255 RepID=UPI0030178A7E